MWKKVKRILSCMLALILLLSLIDGQQFFVRAESEVKATQTEQASNKMEETETSSGKEEGSEANNKENGKQEEGTQKEELSTKATEKTTETKNEDGKVDKPDNLNKENRKLRNLLKVFLTMSGKLPSVIEIAEGRILDRLLGYRPVRKQ